MTVEKRKGKSTLLTINGITKTVSEWSRDTGISNTIINQRIRKGWSENDLFQNVVPMARYSFNEHYFDSIDNEHKAYWIGFIWSDGYLGYRIRENNREEYNLKLTLMKDDYQHLEKFNNDLNGNYKVHYYNYGQSAFKPTFPQEARLFITNKYFGEILRNRYGIVPCREDCDKLVQNIPEHLISHFIRGIVDADGSFCHYTVQEGKNIHDKYSIKICGTEPVLRYIEQYLIKIGLIDSIERKLLKRHKEDDKDARCRTLSFSGRNNVINILNFLYKDADIYLDRKYKKYTEVLAASMGGTNIAI